jgi:hypothetical protein
MRDFKWTDAEKKVARRVFDAALQTEYAALLERLKGLAAEARTLDDIWNIHDFLAGQREAIDDKYDFRYSQLIIVFGRLCRENRIADQDLAGLSGDKIDAIRRIASL